MLHISRTSTFSMRETGVLQIYQLSIWKLEVKRYRQILYFSILVRHDVATRTLWIMKTTILDPITQESKLSGTTIHSLE
jgi:hypothetical protein